MKIRQKSLISYLLITIFTLFSLHIFAQNRLREHEIFIHTSSFIVEIADTDESRAYGLMYRENLDEKRGMLFVFPDNSYRSFYMKNTLIPLSIAYIDENGVILEIYDMQPLSLRSVSSRYKAKYALELNQGAFDRAGIRVGMKITNLP